MLARDLMARQCTGLLGNMLILACQCYLMYTSNTGLTSPSMMMYWLCHAAGCRVTPNGDLVWVEADSNTLRIWYKKTDWVGTDL
jgi:hypothetical protein